MLHGIRRLLLFLSVATLSESFLSVGFLSLTFNKVITALLLGVVLLEMSTVGARMPSNPKNLWMLAFGAAVFPSVATSYLFGVPISGLLSGVLTPAAVILFYFLLGWTVRTRGDLDLVIWGTVIGVGLTAATALLGIGREAGSYYERSGGLGGNPNLLATNCVMGLTLGLFLVLDNRQWWRRTALFGMMAIMVVAFVGTLSRAGVVAMGAMGFFVLFRSRRLDVLRWVIPVAIGATFLIVSVAPDKWYQRIGSIGEEAQDLYNLSLDNDRILGWYIGIQGFLDYPLTGVGLKSFEIYLARLTDHERVTPHSSYLSVLAKMGLVGFVPYMAIVILTWFDFSRAWSLARRSRRLRDPELRALEFRTLYLQTTLIAWLFAGLVSPFAWQKGPWLMFGLSTVVLQLTRQQLREAVEKAGGREAEAHEAGSEGARGGFRMPDGPRIPSTWIPR